MPIQHHIIKKISLELQTAGSQHGYEVQRRCVGMIKETFLNDLDELLSTYFLEDAITRINTIEIDLGNITSENLEKDFVTKFIAGIKRNLRAKSVNQRPSEAIAINYVDKDTNHIEQFFYFLSSGKIRWSVYNIKFPQWQAAVMEAVKQKSDTFKEAFSVFLVQHPNAIERLVMQFDDALIGVLVDLYTPAIKNEYALLVQLLSEEVISVGNRAVRRKVLLTLLPGLLGNKRKIDINVLWELPEPLSSPSPSTENEKKMPALKEMILTISKKSGSSVNTIPLAFKSEVNEGDDKAIPSSRKDLNAENNSETAKDNSIYITNAGLIILHPFLQNLFTTTGLMQSGNFIDDYGKQKAVHLLQYLANGQQQIPEYIMPLNKILCGIPGEEHIDRFVKLDQGEITEANELLQAVVTHWAVLKNTSLETLQETFLQRNGKLTFNETDGYWKLQVEKKAMDILLDKIPWGFAYIKLPWMIFPLSVEW